MASARARLGAARRGIIGRQKKAGVMEGILGTAGTVAAFAGTQIKKASTAWGEYEKGYQALGGTEPIERPGFGQKGWLKSTFGGPSGQVRIGEKMYDRGNIRQAGAFLGSDVGAAGFLGDDKEGSMRKRYLEGVAPGEAIPEAQLREERLRADIRGRSELQGRQEQELKGFLSDPNNLQQYGKDIYAQGAGIGTGELDIARSRRILTEAGWQGGANPTPENVSMQKMMQGSNQALGKSGQYLRHDPKASSMPFTAQEYKVGIGSTFGQGQGGVGVQDQDFYKNQQLGRSQDELIQMSANVESSIGRYGSRQSQFQERVGEYEGRRGYGGGIRPKGQSPYGSAYKAWEEQ